MFICHLVFQIDPAFAFYFVQACPNREYYRDQDFTPVDQTKKMKWWISKTILKHICTACIYGCADYFCEQCPLDMQNQQPLQLDIFSEIHRY